jgi:hypothetical protein
MKFEIRVVQTVANEYEVEASSQRIAEERAIESFAAQEGRLCRSETTAETVSVDGNPIATVEGLTGPRKLVMQPEAEPVHYTHFDCWTATGDDEGEVFVWGSVESVTVCKGILETWEREIKGATFTGLLPLFSTLDGDEFFEVVGAEFVRLGFCYYNGEEFFEVYAAGDCDGCE